MSPLLPGELPGPPPVPERPARVAEAVAVAHRLLEDEGPGALTMRRLAAAMGIRAPSLYKHFAAKADLEAALVTDALLDAGARCHRALRSRGTAPLASLLATYRRVGLERPNHYRLATTGPLPRHLLAPGLEEWAGNPWFVVTGDPARAQALWSFAHGMVQLELDGRYPEGSDLDATWRAGAAAFGGGLTPPGGRPRAGTGPARGPATPRGARAG